MFHDPPVMLGVLIVGDVNVLLVRVCAVLRSAVTAVSIDRVTAPDEPPPDRPVPAVTELISPDSGIFVVTSTRVSVILAVVIAVAPAATAIVAREMLFAGVAGADGLPAGVPATTCSTTLLSEPV
jgi:hypothetical protein